MPSPLKFFAKIARRTRLDLSPLTPTQFFQVATVVRNDVVTRIGKALDAMDASAPPLKTERYKRLKIRRGLQPVRDWKLTGQLHRDIKVKSASSIRAVIGAVSAKNVIKLRANNRRHRQFAMSTNNRKVFVEAMRAYPIIRKVKVP